MKTTLLSIFNSIEMYSLKCVIFLCVPVTYSSTSSSLNSLLADIYMFYCQQKLAYCLKDQNELFGMYLSFLFSYNLCRKINCV